MSSRQIRKLKKLQELENAKLNQQQEDVEAESEDEPILPTKSKGSLFANFAALGEGEEDEDDKTQLADEDEDDVVEESSQVQATPTATKKAKKSKNKKKSKSKKGKERAVDVEDQADDSEDIDALLQELALKDSAQATTKQATKLPVDPEYERICHLLRIGNKHLRVTNEMRDMYGKDFSTVQPTNDNDQGARGGRRAQRGQPQQVDIETALKGRHAPGKGLSAATNRRNALIEAKQHWPNSTTGGLAMEIVEDTTDDETVEFRFTHDKGYQQCQEIFHHLVNQAEPQNLIAFLIKNPYHISTLLAVSRITKDQGDHSLSSELLERALFSFGRAATSQFNAKLSEGKARLDFARPENREFWLAGYHYIKSLIQKGTFRTALEWAKLLLSLDPECDPYKIGLVIHELALRAGENEWMLKVYESGMSTMWTAENTGAQFNSTFHTMPSYALAALNIKDGAKSRELLSKAMQSLPWLFVHLFSELDLTAPSSIWGIMPRNDAEKLYTELYALQTKDLWGTPQNTALLMEIAHSIPKVNADDIDELGYGDKLIDVVRFVYLEGNRTIMSLAPSEILHQSSADWDPYPPEVNIFSYESQRIDLDAASGRGGGNFELEEFYDPLGPLRRIFPMIRGQGNNDDPLPDNLSDSSHDSLPDLVVADNLPDAVNPLDGRGRGFLSRALAMLGWGPEGLPEERSETSADQDDTHEASRPVEDELSSTQDSHGEGSETSGHVEHTEGSISSEAVDTSASQTSETVDGDNETAETSGDSGRRGPGNMSECLATPEFSSNELRQLLETIDGGRNMESATSSRGISILPNLRDETSSSTRLLMSNEKPESADV